MLEVAVDLADDRFDLRYDPARVDAAAILERVRALGYSPELVTRNEGEREELGRVEPASLPGELRELLARARETGKPVLLDFFAPG